MGLDALQIIGEMLAGLALFFVGIQHLPPHLLQITGRKSLSIIFLESPDALINATIDSVNSLDRSEPERMRETTLSRCEHWT
jgi:hypothetical protein